MPQIKFTKNIAPKKGWTTGEVRFWPPSLICSVSEQRGADDWFMLVPEETARERMTRRQGAILAPSTPEPPAPVAALRRGRGRPRTGTPESTKVEV